MRRAGRSLQFLGILVTGIGLFVGLLGRNVRGELAMLAVGGFLFLVGRFLQSRGGGA